MFLLSSNIARLFLPIIGILFIQVILNNIATSYTNSYNTLLLLVISLFTIPLIIYKGLHQCSFTILAASWFFFASTYFVFLASIRNIPLLSYFQLFRYDVQWIVIFIYYSTCTSTSDFKFKLFKIINALIAVQAIIGILQYVGVSYVYIFTELRSYGNILYDNYLNNVFLPHGTLERYNIFGNIMSLMIVYSLGGYVEFRNLLSMKSRLLLITNIIIASYCVLLSGNRISLLSLVISLILFFILQARKRMTILGIIVLIICFFRVFVSLDFGTVASEVSFDNPFTRQLAIASMFNNDFSTDNVSKSISTITLTFYLFEYFINNIWFGAGLFFKSGGYNGLISLDTNNISDAYLMFILAEYGIVGFLIYFAPILYLLAVLIRKKLSGIVVNKIFSVLLCLIIQSITDQGIFHPIASFFLFTFFYAEISSISFHKANKNNSF